MKNLNSKEFENLLKLKSLFKESGIGFIFQSSNSFSWWSDIPNTFLHYYDNQFTYTVYVVYTNWEVLFFMYFLDVHQALGDPFSKACSSAMYSDTEGLKLG